MADLLLLGIAPFPPRAPHRACQSSGHVRNKGIDASALGATPRAHRGHPALTCPATSSDHNTCILQPCQGKGQPGDIPPCRCQPNPCPSSADTGPSCPHPLLLSALFYEPGFPHIHNNAGTGHPSFWKIDVFPTEAGPLLVPCPSVAPQDTSVLLSCSCPVSRQDCTAPTAPQGRCPSPWAGPELLVCSGLGTGPFPSSPVPYPC